MNVYIYFSIWLMQRPFYKRSLCFWLDHKIVYTDTYIPFSWIFCILQYILHCIVVVIIIVRCTIKVWITREFKRGWWINLRVILYIRAHAHINNSLLNWTPHNANYTLYSNCGCVYLLTAESIDMMADAEREKMWYCELNNVYKITNLFIHFLFSLFFYCSICNNWSFFRAKGHDEFVVPLTLLVGSSFAWFEWQSTEYITQTYRNICS